MNPGNAAEKISDLFQVTLNELETNIVSQAIKMSHQPQKLVEELQLSVVEFKQRFYESLQHLLQFIAQICGTNGKEVLRIAQLMEQQVNKFKQQQLLVQMKSVVNQKLKALMETMHIDNKGQKQEIEIQIKLLSESLHKIEYTLQIEQNQQFNTPQYITPYPKKNFCTASSVDQMTPNLSEEAERRGRGFMVTPDQLRPQEPRQFEHSQHPSSSKDSVQQDKTMNSFHNDMHHTLDFQSDQQQLIDNDSAPHFGIDQQQLQQQQTRFQNEIMDEYFSKVPIYTSLHSQLEQINTTRTEQAQTLVENVSIVEQSNEITQSMPHYRKQSTQSVVNQKQSSSPKVKRLINTSKSKESQSRCKTTMDSTNLMNKLNSAADLTKITKKPSMNRVNKENMSQTINKQPLQKSQKPIMITKPKSLVVKKELQAPQLKKSSTK